MSKVDIRLEYQRDTGHGLETINQMAGDTQVDEMCPECEADVYFHTREDILEYVKWLEEKLDSLEVLELLIKADNLFYNEKSNKTKT
ncbi:hypothetical protein LCGC14_2534200 [marine sediment metagenome]|uniref:Uncharacterized protein n=1 Tax=marine sediment metagenome TaxID=412755 RepID=A0A0F9AT06_9ZZZZ